MPKILKIESCDWCDRTGCNLHNPSGPIPEDCPLPEWNKGDDEETGFSKAKIVRAKREYKCCECGETIFIGQSYEYTFMAQGGDAWQFRTCFDCIQIRTVFFRDWVFGTVWDELRNNLRGGYIYPSEKCLSLLNPKNLGLVCEIVEQTWAEEEEDAKK